ncbi:MAG: acetate--CoA ligase family protein [Desulfobulbaceae bacterium]|nr:acetate--CoA ligase family protein [Desulfobulbaceae bacterium]
MLESLLQPQTIALIGASRTPGAFGYRLLANLIEGGFAGTIVPVNPLAETILGLPCYHTLSQFAGKIDLCLIAIPADQCKKAVREAIEAGARAVVILSVGFKESGEAGAELEMEIAETCRVRDVQLLGPNCLGLINSAHKLFAFDAEQRPEPGGISMISQSSSICSLFLDRVVKAHLGVAKLISTGNKAGLSEIDLLRALALDPQTSVIIGYLESINAGDSFVKAAEYATSRKPVIILKSATTLAGRKAVAAHSGELISQDSAYGAAFRRSGVIRAETLGALFDYTAAFTMQPLPRGNRVLVLSNAGGPGIMAVDAVEQAGLTASYLDAQASLSLRQTLSASATIYNPIDLLGDAGPEQYSAAIDVVMADNNVDAVVVLFVERDRKTVGQSLAIAHAIVGCNRRQKPLIACLLGCQSDEVRDALTKGAVPEYDSPERAVAVLKAMCEYTAWRHRPPRVVTRFKVHRRRVERIISRHLRTKRLHIAEMKAKDILKAYDFHVPEGHLTISVEEAIEQAERIGYPVAMKIASPDIVQKSDFGGVRLNIVNRLGVQDSFDLMMLRVNQRAPEAWIDGVYVEKMLDHGLEVIMGMHRDPQFGPMLMFGLGGIYVEVMKDVAFNLAPITFDEAMTMLTSTKSYQILIGARGENAVDMASLAHCLQKISQLATDFPQIAELEINPLIVGEIGSEPVVADAKINLRGDVE